MRARVALFLGVVVIAIAGCGDADEGHRGAGDGESGGRALDVDCGAMGWLRILSEWVGPSGQVVRLTNASFCASRDRWL